MNSKATSGDSTKYRKTGGIAKIFRLLLMTDGNKVNEQSTTAPNTPDTSLSPLWQSSTKRVVVTILVILALLALYWIREILIPLIMSLVTAYIVSPAVDLVYRRTRLSRNASIIVIYLLITAVIIAIPASTIPPLIIQANNLWDNMPQYLEQLGEILSEPLTMADFTIPIGGLPIEEFYRTVSQNLLTIIQTIAPQGFRLFGNLASVAAWIIIILVLSYYLVKDYRLLWGSIVTLAPDNYHADLQNIAREINGIWNAFLRGQLILGTIIALVTFVVTFVIGLPNALLLALLAGLLEFIPNIGPILASIPAILLALFQSDASWLGNLVGPIWFALIVLSIYAVVQRVENVYLVPRVIGRSLNLHPLVVLVGAVVGASVAGIFGILLAAPLLASARLFLHYVYRKLLDQPPFFEPEQV